tara:strand:- start:428 stop:634 length:207 start_codon:yes stop_codon:yes gene_type:complete
MNWKDEIKKYDRDVWNKPALKKLHRGILEYVETEMPPSSKTIPFNESLERKLYKILNMIEPKLNKGDE